MSGDFAETVEFAELLDQLAPHVPYDCAAFAGMGPERVCLSHKLAAAQIGRNPVENGMCLARRAHRALVLAGVRQGLTDPGPTAPEPEPEPEPDGLLTLADEVLDQVDAVIEAASARLVNAINALRGKP